MTGRNPVRGSAAARERLGKSERKLRRTRWWSSWGSEWPDWRFPVEQLLRRRRLAAEAAFRWGRRGVERPGSFTST